MQDLSHRVPGLIVSSMEGGNLTTSNMIANPGSPGSRPVTPMPDFNNETAAVLPLPDLGPQAPVNPMSHRVTSTAVTDPSRPPDRPGEWTGITSGAGEDKPGGGWTLTPSAGDRP